MKTVLYMEDGQIWWWSIACDPSISFPFIQTRFCFYLPPGSTCIALITVSIGLHISSVIADVR